MIRKLHLALAPRVALTVAAALFTASILWAFSAAPFLESFGQIVAMPWGLVTLIDLYLGFACIAILIWLIEPSRMVALACIGLLFLLGNVVTALWLALRLPAIRRRLSSGQGPTTPTGPAR
jgi:hypothetical protein